MLFNSQITYGFSAVSLAVAHDILENRYIDNVKFSFSCPNQWRSQDFSEEEAIVTTQLYGGPTQLFGSLKRHFLHGRMPPSPLNTLLSLVLIEL